METLTVSAVDNGYTVSFSSNVEETAPDGNKYWSWKEQTFVFTKPTHLIKALKILVGELKPDNKAPF